VSPLLDACPRLLLSSLLIFRRRPLPLALAACLQAPAASALPAEGGRNLLKLQLQRAFLEQYSSDEHKVPQPYCSWDCPLVFLSSLQRRCFFRPTLLLCPCPACAAPVHPCLPACLQVKLKDVADYVSDILAYTAASSAADALLAPAGDAIAARLKSEGANCGGLGGGMGSDGGPKLGSSCGWSAACY
jgi:hypothetical protein